METTIQHERDNLRVLTTEYSRIRTQTAAMQRSLAAVAGRNALSALFKLTHRYSERIVNYVHPLFKYGGFNMFRAVVEEAAALASVALFIGTIAIWVQILAVL